MESLLVSAWTWIAENPVATVAIAVYLTINILPRPHPKRSKGWKRHFWHVLDRLSILTAAALPGRFKMLFAASPPPPDLKVEGTR